MADSRSYLQELDEAISGGSQVTRLKALWHATDLLITGQYDEEQIWVFGEIITRLAGEIEQGARIQLES